MFTSVAAHLEEECYCFSTLLGCDRGGGMTSDPPPPFCFKSSLRFKTPWTFLENNFVSLKRYFLDYKSRTPKWIILKLLPVLPLEGTRFCSALSVGFDLLGGGGVTTDPPPPIILLLFFGFLNSKSKIPTLIIMQLLPVLDISLKCYVFFTL